MEFETASQVNPTNVTDSHVINVSSFNKCVDTCTMSTRCVMSKWTSNWLRYTWGSFGNQSLLRTVQLIWNLRQHHK